MKAASTLIGVVPDSHFPDHDEKAVNCALAVFRELKVDTIVLQGDLVDNKQISRFSVGRPNDQVGRLKDGWAEAAEFITECKKITKDVWLCEGNHESRLDKFIELNPSLEGLIDLPSLLGIDAKKYVRCDSQGVALRFEQQAGKVIPIIRDPREHSSCMFHGATFIHGWKYGMHHAKMTGDLVPWPGPVLAGDTHDEQTFSSNRWGPDKPTVYNFGWLGALLPDYMRGRANKWVQGFGTVRIAHAVPGLFQVHSYRVYNGRVITPSGRIV